MLIESIIQLNQMNHPLKKTSTSARNPNNANLEQFINNFFQYH